jgi:hypothetical protein
VELAELIAQRVALAKEATVAATAASDVATAAASGRAAAAAKAALKAKAATAKAAAATFVVRRLLSLVAFVDGGDEVGRKQLVTLLTTTATSLDTDAALVAPLLTALRATLGENEPAFLATVTDALATLNGSGDGSGNGNVDGIAANVAAAAAATYAKMDVASILSDDAVCLGRFNHARCCCFCFLFFQSLLALFCYQRRRVHSQRRRRLSR